MILDAQNLFSDAQAVTATAASTNIIDLGIKRDLEPGNEIDLLVQVVEDFDNLTSLTIAYQTDSASNFGSAVTLAQQTIALAKLKAGAKFAVQCPPAGNDRYVRLYYTVTGTAPSVGKITAGFVAGGIQNWQAYAAGYTV